MDTFDIPILKKTYTLYKELHLLRIHIAKRDRYAIWQRLENSALELLEYILLASQRQKSYKYEALEIASAKLNILRILIRLTKDVRVIDNKKYLSLELTIDEIGRMLGGWLKSTNSPPPPNIRSRIGVLA